MSQIDLDDLRSELTARAAGADAAAAGLTTSGDPAVLRLSGVRARVRARRRRRTTAAIVVAVAAVAAVVLVPVVGSTRADGPATPASSGRGTGSVFGAEYGGDKLIGAGLGRSARTSVTFTFTPSDTNLQAVPFCYLPDALSNSSLEADVRVNGDDFGSYACSNADHIDGLGGDFEPTHLVAVERAQWTRAGIVPGHPVTATVRLQGDPGRAEGLLFGAAVYELDGPRLVTHGQVIKKLVDDDVHDLHYRFAGYRAGVLRAPGAGVSMHLPAQRYPALVLTSSLGTVTSGSTHLVIDGKNTELLQSKGPSGSGGTEGAPDARSHTIGVRLSGHGTVTAIIGYYVRTS